MRGRKQIQTTFWKFTFLTKLILVQAMKDKDRAQIRHNQIHFLKDEITWLTDLLEQTIHSKSFERKSLRIKGNIVKLTTMMPFFCSPILVKTIFLIVPNYLLPRILIKKEFQMSMLESNWLRLVICYFKLSRIIKSLCCYAFESIKNYC